MLQNKNHFIHFHQYFVILLHNNPFQLLLLSYKDRPRYTYIHIYNIYIIVY